MGQKVGVETNCFQNQSQHFDLKVKNDSDFATLRFGPCLSAHIMIKLNAYLNLTANCRSSWTRYKNHSFSDKKSQPVFRNSFCKMVRPPPYENSWLSKNCFRGGNKNGSMKNENHDDLNLRTATTRRFLNNVQRCTDQKTQQSDSDSWVIKYKSISLPLVRGGFHGGVMYLKLFF